jgi:hypothetical protein
LREYQVCPEGASASGKGYHMSINRIRAQISRIDRQKRVLEQKMQAFQQKKLLALARQVGLDSVDSLIVALAGYASPQLRMQLQQLNPGSTEVIDARPAGGSTKRARFPADIKERIRAELESGKKSVAQLSREYGPSHPTIMGWKREWGMTRPRPRRGG